VAPRDAGQVSALLRATAAQGVPLTFRSGGTSLSGQATSDGVLVTGRIMAPFVRRQDGDKLYDVMCEVKRLLDPDGLLNPKLVSDDSTVHIRHVKSTPSVEAEVDRCVECGYCEPVCPRKDLTTTPRRRIVLRREVARAQL